MFVLPGSIDTRTGGYIYDKRIVMGLRALGWSVDVRELDPGFPFPSAAALDAAANVLESLPAASLVVIDGLALGAMPVQVERVAARLKIVGLVHHPLAAETGLAPDRATELEISERRALQFVKQVIVTSGGTRAALAAYGVDAARVAVVEPGTEPAPLARGGASNRLELLCVGTLTARKGHDVLLRALAPLEQQAWRLTCVGSIDRDAQVTARFRRQVEEAGLQDRVVLAGEAGPAAMAAHYDGSDLFVLPTFYEGYGMAVAEALAHGLPVISTPTGGIADLVSDDAGVLVPVGDVPALTRALARVISEREFRRRLKAGAARARANLTTWDTAARMFADVLTRAAA